ncbi:hypothetical protein HK104_001876 [Borealophlyctis nickersoniae]|nr:hypothetical protein HK104_001876 [Borealophlyctis nickersoniae]
MAPGSGTVERAGYYRERETMEEAERLMAQEYVDSDTLRDHEVLNYTGIANFLERQSVQEQHADGGDQDEFVQNIMSNAEKETDGEGRSLATLYDLSRGSGTRPLSYDGGEARLPRIRPPKHSAEWDTVSSSVEALTRTQSEPTSLPLPWLIPPDVGQESDDVRREMERKFSSSGDGTSAAGPALDWIATDVALARVMCGKKERIVEPLLKPDDEDIPTQLVEDSEPSSVPPIPPSPELQPLLLHSPYVRNPLHLSSAAAQLRDRWVDPDKYYGPNATVSATVQRRSTTPTSRKRGRSHTPGTDFGDDEDVEAFFATREDAAPSVLSASQASQMQQMSQMSQMSIGEDWGGDSLRSILSQGSPARARASWSQPLSSLSQGSPLRSSLSQSLSMSLSGSQSMSQGKKKARRKGF